MTTNILSPSWRGLRADPIDPAAIRFVAIAGPVHADCKGCIFIDQSGAVCRTASTRSGLDCDSPMHDGRSMIFVLDKTDARQMNLPIEQQSATTDDCESSDVAFTNN